MVANFSNWRLFVVFLCMLISNPTIAKKQQMRENLDLKCTVDICRDHFHQYAKTQMSLRVFLRFTMEKQPRLLDTAN